jgi:hypothetical protein
MAKINLDPMTPDEYREAIRKVGFTNIKAAGAWLAGCTERTATEFARSGPPLAVARTLRLMIRQNLTYEMVRQ